MKGSMRSRAWVPFALAATAALMAALVYLNALSNPFVYDDYRVVLENLSIRDLSNVRALLLHDVFRPVVNITYAIDYASWRLAPFGYHVTNVLLHMANVVLLFALMRRLVGYSESTRAALAPTQALSTKRFAEIDKDGDRDPGAHASANSAAFAAAVIWAVHPLMTQAVGYVSGRAEVLCAFFFLASLLSLHPWLMERRRAWLVLSIGCWVLALASKEVAVMLPVVLFAYDRLLLSPAEVSTRKRLARVYVAMLIFAAAAGAARLTVFLAVENVSRASLVWANALVGLDVVRRYVSLMVLAGPQSIFYTAQIVTSPLRPLVILNALWMMALGILAWRVHRRAPLVTFGMLWFVLMLLPSVTMLVLDIGEPMAEQRVYLAGAGFAIATGAAFSRLSEWSPGRWMPARVLALVTLGIFLIVLASRTIARNEIWSDPVRLWQEAVVNAPDIWVPYRGLGDALRSREDYRGAIQAYREAARLRPQEVDTHIVLGVTLMLTGRVQEAYNAFAKATRLSPGLVQAETGQAIAVRLLGRNDEARDRLLSLVRAHADAVLPRLYLAELYEQQYSDPSTALRLCREVQILAPQTPGVADCISRNQKRANELGRGSNGR
jgi:hypothetical protein